MKRHPAPERSPLELFEEAFHLVRMAPAGTLATYAVGSLPFVLALLFFWSDMSRSAFADERLMPGVLLLTGLFVWMKAWQSIYCRRLLARVCGAAPPFLTIREFLRTAVNQAIVQPAGLFLIPIASLVMLPFAWVYGFFSSATVINGDDQVDVRTVLVRSWRQMALWPVQNHWILGLGLGFGFFVFLNILTALLGLPALAKTVLGIESVFTRSFGASLNTTLLAAQAALTYLCLDPVMKAVYVLRCFHGESLGTGQDLLAELNHASPAPRADSVTSRPPPSGARPGQHEELRASRVSERSS